MKPRIEDDTPLSRCWYLGLPYCRVAIWGWCHPGSREHALRLVRGPNITAPSQSQHIRAMTIDSTDRPPHPDGVTLRPF